MKWYTPRGWLRREPPPRPQPEDEPTKALDHRSGFRLVRSSFSYVNRLFGKNEAQH
jgi:hypothetical protein